MVRYWVFPREQIRAFAEIPHQVENSMSTFVHGEVMKSEFQVDAIFQFATDLLCDDSKKWPLIVKKGSALDDKLTLLKMATSNLCNVYLTVMAENAPALQNYFEPDLWLDFDLVDLKTNCQGLVIDYDNIALRQPKETSEQALGSEHTIRRFREFLLAFQWVYEDVKQRFWRPRTGLQDISPAEAEFRYKSPREEEPDEIVDTSSLVSHRSNTNTKAFTPVKDCASSPTPTESFGLAEIALDDSPMKLKLTYTATLTTATEKIIMDINPTNIGDYESKVLEATKDMWALMSRKGHTGKVSLEDMHEMAKEMVAKNSAIPLDT